jgi:uncharacterized protein (DUF433 family)
MSGEILKIFTAMVQATEHLYIVKDGHILGGEPIIKGTRTSVRAIVETWRMGVSPEEIPQGLPHLTLAQVFDALSYYSDHQDEINAYIQRNRIPDELIDPLVRDL